MFELTRRMEFSAAHRLALPSLSDEENRALYGVCAREHGHNYAVEVTVRGPADPETGMVMDLERLADLLDEKVFADVDHRHLNHDVPWLAGRVPTAEVLAQAIWDRLEDDLGGLLHRVRLYESRDNFADYLGPSRVEGRPGAAGGQASSGEPSGG